ncbi:hypothetical protein EDC04DRAFT_3140977 [Pisolithus marmoratus]|nr:hypothetical protein EDC04DRAFT_3140977 [Pisolithus marmoratus]
MRNTTLLFRLAPTNFMQPFRGYQTLKDRLQHSPGLPVDDPSPSFWMYPPSPTAKHCSEIPDYADFIVIGSGTAGTSVTRRLLEGCRRAGWDGVRVLMLEARDACSGNMTLSIPICCRNGGHISPPLYHGSAVLQEQYGEVIAQKVIKFRLAHLQELRRVAEEEGILEVSECERINSVDVHYDSHSFTNAKAKLSKYQQDLPFEASHHRVCKASEAIEVR